MDFFKVTSSNLDEYNNKLTISKLPDKVKEIIYGDENNYYCEILNELNGCESPIEQLLAYQMYKMGLRHFNRFNPDIDVIEIEKQETLIINSNKYRVDFLIPVWYTNKKSGKQFIIECDGHDFHEKTKEQAARDKKRDRNLIAAEYVVIRFAGSEIYKNPYGCVKEIVRIILQHSK